MIRRRGIWIAFLTLGAALAAAGGAASAKPVFGPGGDDAIATHNVAQRAAAVRAYWTEERMEAARPIELGTLANAAGGANTRSGPASYASPSTPGSLRAPRLRSGPAPVARAATDVSGESAGFPARTHGKVFVTLGEQDYVCSATVVTSASHALAWTAGHCLHGADLGLGFATNWMLVPAYRDGARPFGSWTATQLATTDGWRDSANIRLDLGAATLGRDSEGRGIEDIVGARGIAFNQSRTQVFDAFGYPAEDLNTALLPPNFDGERLWRCRSPRTANDSPPAGGPETMEIGCDMTAGSSGGSWVIGEQFVNSVTSYGYAFDPDHLYGPYMGDVAEELYNRAAGPPLLCTGVQVTNLGGGSADDFAGTPNAESFKLLGGDDRVDGGGKDDVACGGGGNDRVAGGGGTDRLRGGAGADVIVGGPGADVCDGGPGRDRAFGCATKRRIP